MTDLCEYQIIKSNECKCIAEERDVHVCLKILKTKCPIYRLKQQIKKQENAKIQLKNLDSRFAEDYCNIKEENKNLQEENEGLKKKNKELLVLANKGGALLVAESTKNKKYEQALEEIREITEQDRNCMNSELACCRLCDKLDLIKEKTNEVLK